MEKFPGGPVGIEPTTIGSNPGPAPIELADPFRTCQAGPGVGVAVGVGVGGGPHVTVITPWPEYGGSFGL